MNLFRLIPVSVLLLIPFGCATLDRVADSFNNPTSQPSIKDVVETFPYGGLAYLGLATAAAVYSHLRGGKWKSAFTTVVQTVEPYIPADTPGRAKLEQAQGSQVTALVKKVKGKK